MRDFLKGLDLDKETIDTIMAEHGKLVTEDKEKIKDLETKQNEFNETIKSLQEKSNNSEELIKELETLKQKESDRVLQEQENAKENEMKTRFSAILGDKKFVNEFTEESFYNKFKSELAKEENVGKGDTAIFEALSTGSTNIFQNANQDITTPAVNGASVTKTSDDELRTAMGLDIKE